MCNNLQLRAQVYTLRKVVDHIQIALRLIPLALNFEYIVNHKNDIIFNRKTPTLCKCNQLMIPSTTTYVPQHMDVDKR
jgi:hypothetical protein